ncbi:unnamed protein product [Caenorhabditis nigoni]
MTEKSKPFLSILGLTDVTIKELVKHWDPEVVTAMRSDKFLQRMKTCKFDIDHFHWIVTSNRIGIDLQIGGTRIYFSYRNLDNEIGNPVRKLNGKYLFFKLHEKTSKSDGNRCIQWEFDLRTESVENRMEMLKETTKYLKEFLTIKHYNLRFDLKELKIQDLFIWEHTKKFNNLDISEGRRSLELSPDDLKFILEELKAEIRSLKIGVNDFEYEKPIQGKYLNIENMKWITTKCLMGPDLVKMYGVGTSKNAINLNEIIKNWLNGGSLHLRSISCVYEGSLEDLFEGLNATQSMFSAQDITKLSDNFLDNGRDVRRTTDRHLAIIMFSKGKRSVQFLTWHPDYVKDMRPETCQKLRNIHMI